VNAFLDEQERELFSISPDSALSIRNDRYKIVQNVTSLYVSPDQPCVETTTIEFYEIDEAVPVPQLDEAGTELPLDALTPEQQQNYDELSAQLQTIVDSEPACPGDGNLDLVVDQQDLDDWRFYSESYGLSSVYDLDLDGLTDAADEAIIQDHLGQDCRVK
jgi:hypothetical protein